MTIDKGWGRWDLKNATRLDDIAYYLFMQEYVQEYEGYIGIINIEYDPPDQSWFTLGSPQHEQCCKYYIKANIFLRKEKLVKLKEIQY